MRILFLSTSMGMGGADKQLLSAAQELRARGHEVLIVSLTPLGPDGAGVAGRGYPHRIAGDAPRGSRIRAACSAGPPDPGVAARRGAQPHGARQPHGAGAAPHRAGAGAGLDDPQHLRGRPGADGGVSVHQWPGRPHDHRQPGRRGPIRPGADRPEGPAHGRTERRGHRAVPERAAGSAGGAAGVARTRVRIRLAGGRAVRGREGLSQHAAGVRAGPASARRTRCCCWSGRDHSRPRPRRWPRSSVWATAVRFLGVRERHARDHERGRRLRDVLGVGRACRWCCWRRQPQACPSSRPAVGGNDEVVRDGATGLPGAAARRRRAGRRRCCGSWLARGGAPRHGPAGAGAHPQPLRSARVAERWEGSIARCWPGKAWPSAPLPA